MDKAFLIEQLARELERTAALAHQASADAQAEAREGVTAKERRADARVQIEFQGLAQGQRRRARRAFAELSTLKEFVPEPVGTRVRVGAIVEVEDPETGEGRTFFLAPVGAGMTLTGPGGDGLLSVVTPASPMGRAVLGRTVGDEIQVTVKGETRDYEITWVE